MKKHLIRNRKARWAGISVLLTVLVITVTVLVNTVFDTLAKRYNWYSYLTETGSYDVSEDCYTLLGSFFSDLSEGEAPVEIIFCDTEENLKEDSTGRYLYETAASLAARFPDNIVIRCYDIWTNPNSVKKYTKTLNPTTAEMIDTTLKSTSVIIARESYYRVYSNTEFFVFKGGDSSQVWAYNGEKKLAAGILHAIDRNEQIVCLTNNHGEVFYDYELLYLLDDAGYSIRYINLFTDPIPDGCRLIISCNPNTDLTVADGISNKSEVALLENFLSEDGNAFLLFLEDGTPSLPNFEAFLEDWGVVTDYSDADGAGNRYRYMVQDPSNSLTSDGYTVTGAPAKSGKAAELIDGLNRNMIFKNATSLSPANGFVNNGDGSYTKGDKTFYSLYRGGSTASSWANGQVVSTASPIFLGLTERRLASGTSRVGVISSVDLMTEEYLQSAVYGNTDLLLHLFGLFGKTHTPEGLTIKPFSSTDMSIVTTAEMWRWTAFLAILPVVLVLVAGIAVMTARRRA